MEIKEEVNCKALSTWLSFDDRTEKAFTHKAWCKNGNVSLLDYILGSRMWTGTSYIHNEVKLCSSWQGCSMFCAPKNKIE